MGNLDAPSVPLVWNEELDGITLSNLVLLKGQLNLFMELGRLESGKL